MSTPHSYGGESPLLPDRLREATGRRTFLKWSGTAAAVFAAA